MSVNVVPPISLKEIQDNFGKQLDTEVDNHSIYSGETIAYAGWSRDVVGVPNSGRIKFETIGNLADREHKDTKNTDLSEQRFLNLINKYDTDKNIDPDMWRGAIWGNGKKVRAGDPTQKPPQPDEMDFAVVNDFAGSNHAGRWDASEEAYFLQCQTRSDEQENWDENCALYLVNYIGKFPAGTKLTMEFEHRAGNDEKYGDGSLVWCRGWRDGYFQGGDYHNYVAKYCGPRDYGFKSYSETFTVIASHPDVWVAFEVQDNQPRYSPNTYNRAWIRNWKIKLADGSGGNQGGGSDGEGGSGNAGYGTA